MTDAQEVGQEHPWLARDIALLNNIENGSIIWTSHPLGLVEAPEGFDLFRNHKAGCDGDIRVMDVPGDEFYNWRRMMSGEPVWWQCAKCKKCVHAHRNGEAPTKLESSR